MTAIVAPAILTNACSILTLGTSNRLARVVDRTRVVAAEIKAHEPGSPDYLAGVDQLGGLHVRSQLLIGALRSFYAALGAFAAAALISVLGGVSAFYAQTAFFRTAAIAAVASGIFSVIALLHVTIVMRRETRIAIRNVTEEAKLRTRYRQTVGPSSVP